MGCCLTVKSRNLRLQQEPIENHSEKQQVVLAVRQPKVQYLGDRSDSTQVPPITEVAYPVKEKQKEPPPEEQLPQTDLLVEGNEDEYFSPEELQYAQPNKLVSLTRSEFDDKWVPGEQIGQGSYGRVLMGMNKVSGLVMAVKQVDITNQQIDADKIRALEIEINLLSRLEHKNIVQYYGTQRSEVHMNIFLQYVAGGSLLGMLHKFGKFKESLLKVYVREILEGLTYLHDHGVVHRDIKAANILVESQGVCKVADFGSSKRLNEIKKNVDSYRSIQGTPNFMAPEVVLQQKSGRKADIWSLGCTIIELATGKPPWSDFNNVITIMLKIARTQEPPALPDELSDEAKEFLLCCLQVDPSKRWTARRLLSHPFLAIEKPKKVKRIPRSRSPISKFNPQSQQEAQNQQSKNEDQISNLFKDLPIETQEKKKDKLLKFKFDEPVDITRSVEPEVTIKQKHPTRRHSHQLKKTQQSRPQSSNDQSYQITEMRSNSIMQMKNSDDLPEQICSPLVHHRHSIELQESAVEEPFDFVLNDLPLNMGGSQLFQIGEESAGEKSPNAQMIGDHLADSVQSQTPFFSQTKIEEELVK